MIPESELINRFPDINWLSPLPVMFLGHHVKHQLRHACRFCIVQKQLGPNDIFPVSFAKRDDWFTHQMAAHRPLEVKEAA